MYLELFGSTENHDVVASYLAGMLTIEEVELIAGKEDADSIRKYEKDRAKKFTK